VAEMAFTVGSLLVLPFWLLMTGLPGWSGTRRLMASTLVLIPLPLLYAALLVLYGRHIFGTLHAMVVNPYGSFVRVAADILGTPEGAAIAWMHFLALDLFLGRWEYLDSQERKISPLVMTPVLWLTFLAGPLGLLLYLPLRSLLGKKPVP
jgi:Domain of unknown function (DUF4281)